MKEHREIGKYISILQRMNNMYFASELASYQIGCGQQFFLLQIYNHPGLSLQELAGFGAYDKATATRAVQKLEEEGYVCLKTDQTDKRVRHIYATDKAGPVIEKTHMSMSRLNEILMDGLSEEEQEFMERALIRMVENVREFQETERLRKQNDTGNTKKKGMNN